MVAKLVGKPTKLLPHDSQTQCTREKIAPPTEPNCFLLLLIYVVGLPMEIDAQRKKCKSAQAFVGIPVVIHFKETWNWKTKM